MSKEWYEEMMSIIDSLNILYGPKLARNWMWLPNKRFNEHHSPMFNLITNYINPVDGLKVISKLLKGRLQ